MFKLLINSQVKKSETYTIGLQIKKHYDIRFKKREEKLEKRGLRENAPLTTRQDWGK